MPELISYFVENSRFILTITVVYFGFLWLALVVWTASDLSRRPVSLTTKIISLTLVIFGNLFGLIIYLMIRPQTTLNDLTQEDLERKLVEAQVRYFYCKACEFPVKEDFILCPNCLKKLKNVCAYCAKLLEVSWLACPFCGHNRLNLPPPRTLPAVGQPPLVNTSPSLSMRTDQENLFRAQNPAAIMAGLKMPVETSIYENPQAPAPKRGRGRPRKYTAAVPTVKRGRGRPRKQDQIQPLTVDSVGH